MSTLATRRSVLPPPLRGRGGERGDRESDICQSAPFFLGISNVRPPPSLSLPPKGGGNHHSEAMR